ncbi:MAG: hypothetical protein ACF8R7_09455 [Phycisphaerales bacterium JB039]
MPSLTASSITRARAVTVWVIRAVALALLASGAYLTIKRLVFAMFADFDAAFRVWTEIGEGHSASRGVAMLVVGAALALASGRLARWVIALPPGGCPGCGYSREGAGASAVCPECGMRQD